MELGHLDLLRNEIEKTFGRKILSSADCHLLCLDVSRRTHNRISFNTLRRYFHLMKDNHNPSYYTLDVLSSYCGFTSFEEFISFKKQNFAEDAIKQDQGLLNYLVLLFKNTEVINQYDHTYFSLVHQTINYLEQHQGIVDQFQREISRTPNGQYFYFEQFVNVDKLNSYYGDGLRYYLNEKKTNEAQLFGQSLLCFRSWLTTEPQGIEKCLKAIMVCRLDSSMQPSVCARFYATQLYFADSLGVNREEVLVKARQFYLSIPETKYNYSSYYCFEIVLSEALILTCQYEEALFYIEEIFKKLKNSIPSYIDVALLETIYLFKAIVFAHTERKTKAKEVFDNINPNKFYFLSRRYLTILYLSLAHSMKNKQSDMEQINFLVKETGFTRLLQFGESLCRTHAAHKHTHYK